MNVCGGIHTGGLSLWVRELPSGKAAACELDVPACESRNSISSRPSMTSGLTSSIWTSYVGEDIRWRFRGGDLGDNTSVVYSSTHVHLPNEQLSIPLGRMASW